MGRAPLILLAMSGLLAACHSGAGQRERSYDVAAFPQADRPKSPPAAEDLANEATREHAGEARVMLQQADIRAGMTVADIGAGDGYYTVRLAQQVGPAGRVLAEDIDDGALRRLGDRVAREHLDNVSIRHGVDADPKLPAGSFDRIVLAHVYREVREPYAFLWNLRPALRAGGRVVVVDRDLSTARRGIAPTLLFCEMTAVGYRLAEYLRMPAVNGYYAEFEVAGNRPAPADIRPCRDGEKAPSKAG